MQKNWLWGIALSLAPSLALAAPPNPPGGGPQQEDTSTQGVQPSGQQAPSGSQAGQAGAQSGLLMPPSAILVGESQVTEIRELPELAGTAGKTAQGPSRAGRGGEIERVVGVSAVDRVYQSRDSFEKIGSYFDRQFSRTGFKVQQHTTTPTANAWSVKLPEGGVASVVVRNTQPTTIETIQAVAAETQVPQGTQKAPQP